jgi:hypothetical protein
MGVLEYISLVCHVCRCASVSELKIVMIKQKVSNGLVNKLYSAATLNPLRGEVLAVAVTVAIAIAISRISLRNLNQAFREGSKDFFDLGVVEIVIRFLPRLLRF